MWIKYVSMGVRNVATTSSLTTKIIDPNWEMGHLPDLANREFSDNSKLAILDLTLACQ